MGIPEETDEDRVRRRPGGSMRWEDSMTALANGRQLLSLTIHRSHAEHTNAL